MTGYTKHKTTRLISERRFIALIESAILGLAVSAFLILLVVA
jgi:hypothetical protein